MGHNHKHRGGSIMAPGLLTCTLEPEFHSVASCIGVTLKHGVVSRDQAEAALRRAAMHGNFKGFR